MTQRDMDEFFEGVEFVGATGITKVDDDKRLVWGWASVSTRKGAPVEDLQGDMIDTEDLVVAAHGFMKDYRVGGSMHSEMGIGTVVESMVFTKELQNALGIDLGMEGWLIAVKVDSEAVWKRVKSGELRAFSIGGSGRRESVR